MPDDTLQLVPSHPAKAGPLPQGAGSLAVAAVVLGLMLVAYSLRTRMGRKPAVRTVATDVGDDLAELGERLAGELDRRAARLEVLIAEADRRIATLDRATSRALTEPKPAHHPAPPATPAHLDPSFGEIYRLADEGQTPVDIARRTQRPTGQIELILNLRRGNVAI